MYVVRLQIYLYLHTFSTTFDLCTPYIVLPGVISVLFLPDEGILETLQ